MSLIYAFNGDADGLCALQQLRLIERRTATLVTGVKRDVKLLRRVDAVAGDELTVLDISLDQNRSDVHKLLDGGVLLRYFDHHYAGERPAHAGFEGHIEEAPDVCTSTLVDRYLGGLHRAWAIVAAFGDSQPDVGRSLATNAGIAADATALLERLGILINYNAYGDTVDDLHFDPAELAQQMLPFANPLDFMHHSQCCPRLMAGFEEDMLKARALKPARQIPGATMVVLTNEPWARRALGVLANEYMHAQPRSAIAILSPKTQGGFVVSIRVPAHSPVAADEFCRTFDTGGGRKLAGGINHLPDDEVDRFAERFESRFGAA